VTPGKGSFLMRQMVALVLAGFAVCAPVRALAQAISGELIEDSTGTPVAGAFVVLLNAERERIGGGLTDAEGRFLIRTPGPGTFTLRAERIGYRSASSTPITIIGLETVRQRMVVPVEALQLAGVTARGRRRCEVRPEGARTALLWEEAKKALTVTAWTRAQRLYAFDVAHFQRDLEPYSLKLRSEKKTVTSGVWERPFTAIAAESLAINGYVQDRREGVVYYGPDADVLLSNVFADAHCLQVVAGVGDNAGFVGLAFQPARQTNLVDIRGVLWLDSLNAELRYIEFNYTNLNSLVPTDKVGGRVEFQRMLSGAWIVRRWWIRVPSITTVPTPVAFGTGRRRTNLGTFQVPKLIGFRETGGEVLDALTLSDADRGKARAPLGAALGGVLWDSTAARPLAGAKVYLSGTPHSAVTDSAGRFRFDDIGEGNFFVAVAHALLDSLMYHPAARAARVRAGEPAVVNIDIPSMATLLRNACPALTDSTGVIIGSVTEPRSGVKLGGARVAVSWQRTPQAPPEEVTANADEKGMYRLCGVPVGQPLELRASLTRTSGSPSRLQLEHAALLRRDLTVP
jgi:hypothetical protein